MDVMTERFGRQIVYDSWGRCAVSCFHKFGQGGLLIRNCITMNLYKIHSVILFLSLPLQSGHCEGQENWEGPTGAELVCSGCVAQGEGQAGWQGPWPQLQDDCDWASESSHICLYNHNNCMICMWWTLLYNKMAYMYICVKGRKKNEPQPLGF